MMKKNYFLPALLISFTAIATPLRAQVILFADNFESGNLNQWTGQFGDAHHGVIVPDPLNPSNNVVTFAATASGGDMFSVPSDSVNATTQRLVLSFDFLGLPAGGVTPPEFGGFAGIARDTTGTASFFMAGTFLPALNVPPPAATLLVADGLWHHYEIDFSSFASTANLTSAQVVLEDWFDRGSIPGDVYFDNIKLKASVNAAVIGQLVPCAGPAPGGTWKNHGQYVSAVDNLTQSLLALGLISPEEQLAFVLTAGESECGRKK